MQHYSSNFQILSKEKEHVHPPSCLWVRLLSRPVPVRTNPSVWAFLKSRCTLFLLFPLRTCVVWPAALVSGLSIFVITTRVFSEVTSLEFLLTAHLEAER